MIPWLRERPGRANAVAAIALLVIALAATVAPLVAKGDEQLSAFGTGARDAGSLADALETAADVEVAATVASPLLLERVADPERTLLFILGVEKPLTSGETAAIRRLVESGATLVLADDTGNANTLLKDTGVAVVGRQLVDLENNYRVEPGSPGEPEFPVADATLNGQRYPILFNKPSFIDVPEGASATVVTRSGTASFDATGGSEIGLGDEPGPYTLIVEVPLGGGRVLLVSDTGPFLNAVMALSGGGAPYRNYEFAAALVAHYLPDGGDVLIDESRHVQPAPVRTANGLLRYYALATLTPLWREGLLGLIVLAAAAVVWRTRPAEDWSRHRFDVGEKRPLPPEVSATPERIRAMALRHAAEEFNVSTEYLQAMSREEVARLTGDAVLTQVIAGNETDSRIVLQKLIGAPEERTQ